jgi:hypothetical protein
MYKKYEKKYVYVYHFSVQKHHHQQKSDELK